MKTNDEKEQVFRVIDSYLRDVIDIDKLGVIEDLVYDYTESRNINVRWIEMY